MRGETVLIVDDEKLIRWSLQSVLTKAGFRVIEAQSVKEAVRFLREQEPDLMILDQILPDGTGIEILNTIKAAQNAPPVIMLTAIDRSDTAVQAMKLGAFDYVTKPVNMDELILVVEKALESTHLKRQVAHYLKEQEKNFGFCGMIGSSEKIQIVYDAISKIARSNGTTVLITGESGTGKELAARALHFLSARRNKPLLTVNCSALSESLIESELFGHERGAFTDAKVQKKGVFELADGGTILLDEIGDISPSVQVKLLRVIEQKTFHRVGGTSEIMVDLRIIAATNKPLEQLISEGKFRTDLYYRLNVAAVSLPPVRERGDDIIMLAEFFLHDFSAKFQKQFKGLSGPVKTIFLQYPWPGNIREIRNVLEHAVLLNDDEYIQPEHLHLNISGDVRSETQTISPPGSLYEMEKQALLQALEKARYNKSEAARLLKISRDTLRYRLKKYDLKAP